MSTCSVEFYLASDSEVARQIPPQGNLLASYTQFVYIIK
jgi:hypothetical protein